jgi:uncharacterized DUF497 family protein
MGPRKGGKQILTKHGVSFDEAKTVFDDLFSIELFDPDHSVEEDRFIIVGESIEQRRLIVSYTERENHIRIISARSVTPKEDATMNTEDLNDELRPEYDLTKLRVKRVGEAGN